MIAPTKLSGGLNRLHILGALHHADEARFSLRVRAHGAGVHRGDIAAGRTPQHRLRQSRQRRPNLCGHLGSLPEQPVDQARSASLADTRKALELGDGHLERIDRLHRYTSSGTSTGGVGDR